VTKSVNTIVENPGAAICTASQGMLTWPDYSAIFKELRFTQLARCLAALRKGQAYLVPVSELKGVNGRPESLP
jgi:hypothetical protein